MDFEKIAKQRAAKSAAVDEAAREQLEAAVKPAKGRPPLSVVELERQEARSPEQAAAEEAEYQRAFEQKLAAQQAAAAEQLNEHRATMQRSKPGPKRRAESKRNSPDWVAFTAFLKPETRDRLQNVIHMARSAGVADPADQSEALDAALQPYLAKMEKSMKAKLAKQLGL